MMTLMLYGKSVQYGGSAYPAISAIDDWCARVAKVADDCSAVDRVDAAWTTFDLIGAYALRDAIEQLFEKEGQLARDYPPTLNVADALLETISSSGARAILMSLEPDAEGLGWWWDLRPTVGPIARELNLEV